MRFILRNPNKAVANIMGAHIVHNIKHIYENIRARVRVIHPNSITIYAYAYE